MSPFAQAPRGWIIVVVAQSLSCVSLFVTPWSAAHQPSLVFSSFRSLLKIISIELMMPSHHLVLCCLLLLWLSIFPSIRDFGQWVGSMHQMAKVLELQLQHQSFQRNPSADLLQNGLVGSPCSPRDSQESFPTPQFKGISSSALNLPYGPTITSIHDYWKNHSFD